MFHKRRVYSELSSLCDIIYKLNTIINNSFNLWYKNNINCRSVFLTLCSFTPNRGKLFSGDISSSQHNSVILSHEHFRFLTHLSDQFTRCIICVYSRCEGL